MTIVSVEDPKTNVIFDVSVKKINGDHAEVMKKLKLKVKESSPANFVGLSICPANAAKNDQKVTLCVNYYEKL